MKPLTFFIFLLLQVSVATDVNKEGRPDVVVGNKKGVFVLLQKANSAKAD